MKKSILHENGCINDANYKVSLYKTENGKQTCYWVCPIYQKWSSMLKRVYDPTYHETRPTYTGISVCDDWKLFSTFKKWIEGLPINIEHIDKLALDKDLLSATKIYSPETCLLIPDYINNAFRISAGSRGSLPLGVSLDRNVYKSSIRVFGKLKNLGRYKTPDEAHRAWQLGKISYINDLILKYKTENFYYDAVEKAMMDIADAIQLDYNNNKETKSL